MASASVVFVILVGVVTFSAWPHAGSLLGDRGGSDVALQEVAKPPPAQGAAPASPLNLVRLLGGGGTTGSSAPRFHGGPGVTPGLVPGEGAGGLPQGGSNGQVSQPQEVAQPPASTKQSNVVSQTLSGVGNTVQKDTESLGNTLGGSSSPGLGGVLGGLGNTLNDDLQTLAGNH